MAGNPGNVSTENINEVILRLLKLNPGTELDYQTYAGIIKKKLASARMTGAFLPAEEDTLLREEFKRVRNKKGRFKVKEKTTRVSTPPPPSAGPRSSGGGGGGMPPRSGSIVKAQKGKITADKFAYHYYVQPVFVKDVTEKTAKVSKKSDPLENINNTLDSILKTLTDINKEDRKARERQRVDAERRQREGKEKGMESRSFEGLKKALSAITKPFQSIFDRIINFIFYTLLGRAVMKLLDWFGDPKNQGKIQSIIRFFSDHWPTLLALYLRFGTGLGRFIGKLGGVLIKGAFKLGALAAKLALKAGIGKAGGKLSKVAGFLGGPRGKAVAAVAGIAADVAVTAGTSAAIDKLAGGGGEGTQKFSGGGAVRFPKFAGGGFANFGKMFGAGIGGGAGSGMFGLVNGPKGKDKVPAMLTDGEFVMSVGAVNKYGVETLEAMNAAGGGTNQPKVVGGKTYAAEGGPIGRRNPDNSYSGSDPVAELRKHFNNFIRSRGAGSSFDIGNPSTWGGGGGTSPSGGGGSGGFLSGLGYLGRAANQIPKMVGPSLGYAGRVAGEVNKRVAPSLGYAGRVAGEVNKRVMPTLNRAGKVAGEVKKRTIDPTINAARGFKPDLSGIKSIVSNASGAASEALPALINSTLGISTTDKSISEDMQRALLQARQTAKGRGRDYVDYKDYVGGGLSAGGLTMGRIADKEWKRDAKGRIIGLRQVYDTNRSAKEAWNQGMQGFGQFFKSGFRDTSALGRGIYKPAEALLALTQNRGKTMHDVNFSEKVLGFKPGKEVLSPTQKKMISEQKNREALQAKRPWWDKMGLFGGASANMKTDQQKKQEFLKRNPAAKLYDKPKPNTGQPYKSRFARPKNAGVAAVKPPTKKPPVVVRTKANTIGSGKGGGSRSAQKAPTPSPRHPKGTGTTSRTQGVKR